MAGRKISHWTPRYIYDRIRVALHGRRHPEWPWLTKDSVLLLDMLLKPTDVGIEFGSGRSSIWFAKRMSRISSVEHNAGWYERVTQLFRERGVQNADVRLRDAENYVDIFDDFEDASVDFVLVDGIERDRCTERAIPELRPGGLLVIDDVRRYAPWPTRAPYRVQNGYPSPIWEACFTQMEHWRRVRTSSGIADTVILFKP